MLFEHERSQASFSTALAVAQLRAGKPVILVDDTTGLSDLVATAETISGDTINFMAKHAKGLLALALAPERVEQLRLKPMALRWGDPKKPFTVSIEAKEGVSTGISAPERAHTVRTAAARHAQPADLISPGHVFPLRARAGGLLAGGGRAEAALELAVLASSPGGAVLMEILGDDGDLAEPSYILELARRFDLCVVTIAQVARHLRSSDVTARTVGPSPPVAFFAEGL